MPFSFIYKNFDEPFYVFINDEGVYCAKVFDIWVYGGSVERVIKEIDEYCYELMAKAAEHQGR